MALQTFSFPGVNYTKDAVTSALRYAYKNMATVVTPAFPQYTYSETEKDSKIQIYKEFPRRIFKPPTLVVRAGPSTTDLTYLGDQELIEEQLSINSVTYNGKFTVPITVHIYTLNSTDREKLTDLTSFFFRHLFRAKFAELGLAYNKISTAGEGQTEWDNQILFTNAVNVDIYQEYTATFPVAVGDLIKSFEINVIPDP